MYQCIKKVTFFALVVLHSGLCTPYMVTVVAFFCNMNEFEIMWAPVQTRLFLAEDHLVISTIKGLIVLSICVCILLQPQFSSSSGRLTMSVTYGIEGPINHGTVHGGLCSGCSLSRYNSTSENWYSQSWGQSWLYLSRRTVQILGVVPSHISTIHLWGKHSPLLSESYLALTSWHLDIFRGDTRWINFDQDTPLSLMCLFYQPYLVKSTLVFVNK